MIFSTPTRRGDEGFLSQKSRRRTSEMKMVGYGVLFLVIGVSFAFGGFGSGLCIGSGGSDCMGMGMGIGIGVDASPILFTAKGGGRTGREMSTLNGVATSNDSVGVGANVLGKSDELSLLMSVYLDSYVGYNKKIKQDLQHVQAALEQLTLLTAERLPSTSSFATTSINSKIIRSAVLDILKYIREIDEEMDSLRMFNLDTLQSVDEFVESFDNEL